MANQIRNRVTILPNRVWFKTENGKWASFEPSSTMQKLRQENADELEMRVLYRRFQEKVEDIEVQRSLRK